jgi:hypothetical protein
VISATSTCTAVAAAIPATLNTQVITKRIEQTPYLDVLLPFYRASANTDVTLAIDPVDGRRYF